MKLCKAALAIVLCLSGAASSSGNAGGAELVLRSGPRDAAVVELYTSEGCSSCPPADRWLSGLRTDPRLWKELLPVSFHVDYWDSLGWRDPFAQAKFTRRQQDYGHVNAMASIYTPGFFLDGREWRPSSGRPSSTKQSAGSLVVKQISERRFAIRFEPGKAMREKDLSAWGGLLGNGLTSSVERGENGGRELRHDFVVLQGRLVDLKKDRDAFVGELEFAADSARKNAPKSWSVVFWVSRAGHPAPLQAVGGDWPEGPDKKLVQARKPTEDNRTRSDKK